jgi:catechol 2,3-dioxygenase-like lactoylglutathione lyase family enzyme
MLDHVGLNVRDYAASRRFYERALEPLGYAVVTAFDEWKAAGFGRGGKPSFWISEREPFGAGTHVAFEAADGAAVSMRSMPLRSPPAVATTVPPESGRSITRPTTPRSCSTRTATTPKP